MGANSIIKWWDGKKKKDFSITQNCNMWVVELSSSAWMQFGIKFFSRPQLRDEISARFSSKHFYFVRQEKLDFWSVLSSMSLLFICAHIW